MDTNKNIEEALRAINNNDKTTARKILSQAIQTEPNNDQAWILFSYVAEKREQSIYCLERALQINPKNLLAKAKLNDVQNTPSDPDNEVEESRHEIIKSASDSLIKPTKSRDLTHIKETAQTNKRGTALEFIPAKSLSTAGDWEGSQKTQRQCPKCGSYKVGGLGPFGMGAWGWVVHLVLMILTGGIWLFLVIVWVLIKDIGAEPAVRIDLRCGGCGWEWKEPVKKKSSW